QGLHGDRANEVGGRFAHDHLHAGAFLDEGTAQFRRLVAGHAPGQAEDDFLALEVHAHRSSGIQDLFTRRSSSRTNRTAPTEMPMSAMLKAGKWPMPVQ